MLPWLFVLSLFCFNMVICSFCPWCYHGYMFFLSLVLPWLYVLSVLGVTMVMCSISPLCYHGDVFHKSFVLPWLCMYCFPLCYREDYDVPTGQEDSLRQTVLLAEELLDLLIIILSQYKY